MKTAKEARGNDIDSSSGVDGLGQAMMGEKAAAEADERGWRWQRRRRQGVRWLEEEKL